MSQTRSENVSNISSGNVANISSVNGASIAEEYVWIWDDATWILGASFIVFTMQTGEHYI